MWPNGSPLEHRDGLMSVAIETLFTTALGLQAPWEVEKVELNTTRRRIDFEVV